MKRLLSLGFWIGLIYILIFSKVNAVQSFVNTSMVGVYLHVVMICLLFVGFFAYLLRIIHFFLFFYLFLLLFAKVVQSMWRALHQWAVVCGRMMSVWRNASVFETPNRV